MRLRFFPDFGAGGALWAADDEARERWDPGPLDERLALRAGTRAALSELVDWWDTALDWSDPGGPGLWDSWDSRRFHRAAGRVVDRVRLDLGVPVEAEWLERPDLPAPPAAPPGTRRVQDPRELGGLLAPDLHLYARGDLDPLMWPEAAFYERGGAVVLGWYGVDPPCFAALGAAGDLLARLAAVLPERMYLQLSPGLDAVLQERLDLRRESAMERMMLRAPAPPPSEPTETLGPRHHRELRDLYAEAHPHGWLDPRTLATRRYVGVRREGLLVAAAGVHVWSPALGVAALGNVATLPGWRGQGLASACVAGLCQRLWAEDGIRSIGLNVSPDNEAARRCYARLGFEPGGRFEEWTAVRW